MENCLHRRQNSKVNFELVDKIMNIILRPLIKVGIKVNLECHSGKPKIMKQNEGTKEVNLPEGLWVHSLCRVPKVEVRTDLLDCIGQQ